MQGTYRIEYGYDHNSDICEYRKPHICVSGRTEHKADELNRYGKRDIFIYYTHTFAGYSYCPGDTAWAVVHDNDIGSLDSGIRAECTHSDADIRAGKHGSVVYSVADKSNRTVLAKHILYDSDLVGGHERTYRSVDTELRADLLCGLVAVARQHYRIGNAECVKVCDSLLSIGLDYILDKDMACILALESDMNDRSGMMALEIFNAELAHQLIVADSDSCTVNKSCNSFSAMLGYV